MSEYTDALTSDQDSDYAFLHAGPVFDTDLGLTLIGSYDACQRIMDNDGGQFSNKQSVFPYWIRNPLRDLSPGAIVTMAGMLGYSDAMQTLDGERHATIYAVVRDGLRPFASGERFRNRLDELVTTELERIEGDLVSAATIDLRRSMRRIALGVLSDELGLSEKMAERVEATTIDQGSFLWGYPRPVRREHRRLAKTVIATLDDSRELLDEYLDQDARGAPVPDNVTATLMRSVRAGRVTKRVAAATLFGLVNAGEGTTSGTGTNVAKRLLESGGWSELASSPDRIGRCVSQLIPTCSAVHGWLKDVTADVTVDGPHRSVDLVRGQRLLLVLKAMNTDPLRGDRPERAFSGGAHECPGRSQAHVVLRAIMGRFIVSLPNLRLAGTPRRITNIAFSTWQTLPVTTAPRAGSLSRRQKLPPPDADRT